MIENKEDLIDLIHHVEDKFIRKGANITNYNKTTFMIRDTFRGEMVMAGSKRKIWGRNIATTKLIIPNPVLTSKLTAEKQPERTKTTPFIETYMSYWGILSNIQNDQLSLDSGCILEINGARILR